MYAHILNRPYRYIAIACILLFLASLIAVFSYIKWREVYYFGTVTHVDDSAITITDPKLGERTIELTDSTIIKIGKHRVEQVSVGQRLIIIAEPDLDGSYHAESIRIVGPSSPNN